MIFIPKIYAFLEFSQEEIQEHFDGIQKCKYIGKVLEVTDIKPPPNGCFSTLKIKTQLETGNSTLLQNGFVGNLCDIGDNLSIHYNKAPIIGEEIFGITDKNSGYILRAGKKYFDEHTEIPLCIGGENTKESLNISTIGLGVSVLFILFLVAFFLYMKKSKHKK